MRRVHVFLSDREGAASDGEADKVAASCLSKEADCVISESWVHGRERVRLVDRFNSVPNDVGHLVNVFLKS